MRLLVATAAAGSALALAGALFSQYALGLAPCQLCLWQRWPHLAAVLIGAVALWPGLRAYPAGLRALAGAGALAAATSGAIGIYHTGVERAWWQGPSACSGAGGLGGLSPDALLDPTIAVATVIPCGEVAAEALGLSMASWNAVVSFALAALWLWAAQSGKGAVRRNPGNQRTD